MNWLQKITGVIMVSPDTFGPGIDVSKWPHAAEAVEKIKNEIISTGKVKPIEATRDGFIVDGEHRYRALRDLGAIEIPVFLGEQDGATGRLVEPYRGLSVPVHIPWPEELEEEWDVNPQQWGVK